MSSKGREDVRDMLSSRLAPQASVVKGRSPEIGSLSLHRFSAKENRKNNNNLSWVPTIAPPDKMSFFLRQLVQVSDCYNMKNFKTITRKLLINVIMISRKSIIIYIIILFIIYLYYY